MKRYTSLVVLVSLMSLPIISPAGELQSYPTKLSPRVPIEADRPNNNPPRHPKPLRCLTGQLSGEGLTANETIVTNTSGRTIPQGTTLYLVYYYPSHLSIPSRKTTETAHRNVDVNAQIPLGDSGRATRCSASLLPPGVRTHAVIKR